MTILRNLTHLRSPEMNNDPLYHLHTHTHTHTNLLKEVTIGVVHYTVPYD